MKMNQEEKVEIAEGWNTTRYRNTYDPLGEVFFFAAGPFFKPPVFLAPAFAFGRGLLRERSSPFLSLIDTAKNRTVKATPFTQSLARDL
jgi:hypothetical protein